MARQSVVFEIGEYRANQLINVHGIILDTRKVTQWHLN